jgi:hypothetical protein
MIAKESPAKMSHISARVNLPNLPAFALDIPLRSGDEAFGFLAAFIAHIEGVECPVRHAYRAMGMEDHRPNPSDRGIGKRG